MVKCPVDGMTIKSRDSNNQRIAALEEKVRYPLYGPINLNISRSRYVTPWRNGSASDSRSEGCVFKSRRGQDPFANPLNKKTLVLEILSNNRDEIPTIIIPAGC